MVELIVFTDLVSSNSIKRVLIKGDKTSEIIREKLAASRGRGKMKVALQISKVNNPFEVFFDREKPH